LTESIPGRRLIIADSHVGTIAGDAEAMEAFLRRVLREKISEIIYLGDCFQYLIGIEKFWTSSIYRILGVWDELRAAGIRISLIEGNRDFFLDEEILHAHFDLAAMEINFSAGPLHYRLLHGDRINHRDLQYLFWSKISKCRFSRFVARMLPNRLAVSIVEKMEARLATTNRRFRYHRPEADLIRKAKAAFAEGVDVLLLGHFHSAWKFAEGGSCLCIVPAWLETRESLLVEEDGSMRLVDEEMKSRPWPPEND